MTRIPTDFATLQQAILQLSRLEREELAEWILNSAPDDWGVKEAARPYAPDKFMTVEEFLNMEPHDLARYEYVAGQVFAMASPLVRHEVIAANLHGHFFSQLRGTPCRAWSANTAVRLKVDRDDFLYLPDVMVNCGPIEGLLKDRYLTNPCLVVEVLSASTEATDRREKAVNYRHCESIEEILLVAQISMEVTVLRRRNDWKPELLCAPQDVFESRAVPVRIALKDIYEGAHEM